MQKGFFITVEGIDGAGKSTHLQRLCERLRSGGRVVTLTREPGGTALAEQLRTLLLHTPMDALTQALLAFAARRDHVRGVIAPALARGEVVVSDRFSDASFAYQGGGGGLPWAQLQALEGMVLAGVDFQQVVENQGDDAILAPDLTLWLDIAPEVAAARLAHARVPDQFEARPLEFFQAVSRAYAKRCEQSRGRCVRIDAHQPREAVWAAIEGAVLARLG